MGIKECFDHGLINNFRILETDENEFVARLRFAGIMHNGVFTCIGGEPTLDHPNIGRKKPIESEAVKKLLAARGTHLGKGKKKKLKKPTEEGKKDKEAGEGRESKECSGSKEGKEAEASKETSMTEENQETKEV